MAQSKHLGTLRRFKHEVRFVFDMQGQGGGVYGPVIHAFLRGPNGSPAGFGPKGWPTWLSRRFDASWNRDRPPEYRTWTSSLTLYVPHLKWKYAYRWTRWPGMWPIMSRLYKWNYKLNQLAVDKWPCKSP